ncbi:hypothetical protein I3760_14G097500 [Carya illinoinensis]|nr:hypothetical protein I3760_14G097500 [Carya illinoinensis]
MKIAHDCIQKSLQFIHEREISHLDVKPYNIYVKNGVYKLSFWMCNSHGKSLQIE